VGDCEFEPANQRWGIEGGAEWTAAFSAMWEPRAVLPTLVFGNYLAIEDNDDRNRCDDHQLFRPEGDSYSEPETLSPGWCTLSVLFSDWDDSGSPDLRVTNDRHYYRDGQEQMWDFQPGEEPRLYTQEDGWALMQIWGMGIASQDLDEDGLPEVFLTSQGDNKLQTLTAGSGWPSYEDEALAVGVTAHRPFAGDTDLPSTAWHAEFDDVNNDGYLDLLITKGNVDSQEGFAMEDPNNLLLGQPDGGFVEGAEAAGFLDFELSRGGALADLNLDGLLDVVVVERREPVRLWRNEGVAGSDEHWLAVDIEQSGPNTDAIGATVEVKVGPTTISNELTVGGGHASGEIGWSHFGLGPSESAELRIVWPDGAADSWTELDADRFYLVERGSEPRLWDPGTG
jgi:hypothetical protein